MSQFGVVLFLFFFKQKTAYEMRISDWSSDVCSSDLCRLDEDTVVIFCADHGDMLGERGLWFKMSFFEGSARIPLMVAGAGLGEGRVDTPVSALDILPTLLDLAGIDAEADAGALDGESLLPLAGGGTRPPPARDAGAEGKR